MNNETSSDIGTLLLDIGGLDKAPVDRGLTVRTHGDFKIVNIGSNGMFASIELSTNEINDLRDALASGLTIEEQAAEAVESLFNVTNKMSGGQAAVAAAVSDAMNHQHRTLIQSFWGAIAKAIAAFAAMPDNFTDARNHDSHEWAKKVAKIDSYMGYI